MVSEMTLLQANISSGNYNNCIHIFFFLPKEMAYNSALKKIYTRQYIFIDSYTGYYTNKIIHFILPLKSLLKLFNKRKKQIISHFEIDKQNVLKNTLPHILFSKDEDDIGRNFLNRIPKSKGIICLSLKERSYYQKLDIFSEYPMAENEFANIDNYIQAINNITKKGFFVIRMGGSLESKSITMDNPLYFDYAVFKDRSDFLDLYIAHKCSFHFSNGTGYDQLGGAFRKPVYYTSVRSYKYLIIQYPFTLFLPVQVYSKKEDRLLTFREIFSLENEIFIDNKHYANCITEMNRLGYYYKVSQPPEIANYAIEVLNHFKNKERNEKFNNNILVNKFWDIYYESDLLPDSRKINRGDRYINPSIDFLRNNEWMLE